MTKLVRVSSPGGASTAFPQGMSTFLAFDTVGATFSAPNASFCVRNTTTPISDHDDYETTITLPAGGKAVWSWSTDGASFYKDQVAKWDYVHAPDVDFIDETLFRQSARFIRFDPDSLRKDSPLLVGPDEARLLNEQGFGLPAVYDAILNRQDDSMKHIVEQVRELFPTVKVVRLKTTSPNTKAIEVELKGGARVPARFLSEGLLYYLAFEALPYLEPTSLLLVEEPENGLHPARIADVVRLLREMSKTTQVVMATHSPLVINELSGDEVSVVTRTETEGTKVTLLRDTPNFEKRSQAYALGELWVSYADGETESALLQGGPPP
jgi:hypothetical protein